MAYTEEIVGKGLMPVGSAVLAEEDLDAAAAVHGEYVVLTQMTISRIAIYITELVASNTADAVVTFKKRSAFGVSSAEETLGTLTIPDTTALGKVVYKDITPVNFAPGETLALDHTTQGTDASSSAGKGIYMWEADLDPEDARNQTDMVESA